MKMRDLCSEITEGFEALAEAREGKRTLRTHAMSIYRRDDVLSEWELGIASRPAYHGMAHDRDQSSFQNLSDSSLFSSGLSNDATGLLKDRRTFGLPDVEMGSKDATPDPVSALTKERH